MSYQTANNGLLPELELHEVAGWTPDMKCTETAICGATGLPAAKVISALNETVLAAKAKLNPNGAYQCEHWLDTLKKLGVKHSDPYTPNGAHATIRDFVNANNLPFVMLLQTEKVIDGEMVGHLIAVKKRAVLDNNTKGKVAPIEQLKASVGSFMVKHVIDIDEVPLGAI